NFVNNFSEVRVDLIEEMDEEMNLGNTGEVKAIVDNLKQNLEKITFHGKRASFIVKGMLEHSRTNKGEKKLTDINLLADEFLRLSYHGLRDKDKSFNADFKTDFDEGLPKINIIPQDFGRVLLNLINNAFYACAERSRSAASKASVNAEGSYKPMVIISTKKLKDKVEIKISDNGKGIPEDVKGKIFQPFFTTKPTGEGTGLGLSLSYDIITKGHGGELKVETVEAKGLPDKQGQAGTTFSVLLPI
ncbi:MAG: histidine kinase, partial [Bacteroidetes bacterium]